MPIFFVLINSDIASEKLENDIGKTLNKTAKFEFINCYGVYDAVLKVTDKKEDPRGLSEKIKSLSKVHSTMILTVMEDSP